MAAPAQRARTRRAGRVQGAQRRAPWILLSPFLLLFLLTMVLPVVYAIGQSLTRVERGGLLGETGISSSFAGLANYQRALADTAFLDSVGRVLLFGLVQVPVMIVSVTVLALLLESASARWPGLFRAAYFMPYGIPGVIASILWSFLYLPGFSPVVAGLARLGLDVDFLGASTVLWSIANIVTWTYAGYNMLIVIAQLKAIPGEVYEAAKVDGAGPLRVAWSVQLPLIRPALVLTTVFSIIGTLQLFAEPQVLRDVSPAIDVKYTPNFAAYSSAFSYNDYGVASAQAVLIAVAAFVLSFTFLRLTGRKEP
ncbi:carbohydrate ABC transporter permease [Kineococcus sp. SYSU DK003]|uniref:carbohydrate ABC transporter permease n=1 Tax=Kineococcus sp. SYSU DK003 TaxID=3383124 RepID=UPI003D7C8690